MNWDESLIEQVSRNYKNYERQVIELDSALINKQFTIPGDFIYIIKVSSKSATANIRFNLDNNPPITLKLHTRIKTIFNSFFISCDSQAGEWIELIIGINFEIQRAEQLGNYFEDNEVDSHTFVDDAARDTTWGQTITRIDITIWTNPVLLRNSPDGSRWGDWIEINKDTFYSIDVISKKIQVKNKNAGNNARYQLVGWY